MVEDLWQLVQSPNPMEGFSQENPKDSDSSDDLMTLSAHAGADLQVFFNLLL